MSGRKFIYVVDFGDFTKIGASSTPGRRFIELHRIYRKEYPDLLIHEMWHSYEAGDNWNKTEEKILDLCREHYSSGPFIETFYMKIGEARHFYREVVKRHGINISHASNKDYLYAKNQHNPGFLP